jgi:hypothetical protein
MAADMAHIPDQGRVVADRAVFRKSQPYCLLNLSERFECLACGNANFRNVVIAVSFIKRSAGIHFDVV